MGGSLASMMVPDEVVARRVERLMTPLDDVVWMFGGSRKLVEELRFKKHLKGKKYGRTLFFDNAHLADVAGRWFAGEFDELLK